MKFRAWTGNEMEYNVFACKFGAFYTDGFDPNDLASLNNTTLYPDVVPIMICTGIKDKNGKDIYEGDIVTLGENKYPRIIEWNVLGLRVKQINSENNFPLHYPFVGQSGFYTDWEVIGNIHETPELFKS